MSQVNSSFDLAALQASLPPRYKLISKLGAGGLGLIFKVRDRLCDQEIALKLAHGTGIDLLRREFDTLRQVRHENLVEVHRWVAIGNGSACYTMELVTGEDWSRRIGTQQHSYDLSQILVGVLRGMGHLHCHRVVHGDLKPGNILLGDDGGVKLADLGTGALSPTGNPGGTPGYSAPELWSGSRADERSDIYSIGIMAYQALTGIHPFAGRTKGDVIRGQLQGWVPSPTVHGVKAPSTLERAIMRALERDPALRPSTADEFLDELGVANHVGDILGGRFSGRASELGRLDHLLNSDGDGPNLVWLGGTPGSGRLSLLGEWCHRAAQHGALVLELLPTKSLSRSEVLERLVTQLLPRGEGPGLADAHSPDAASRLVSQAARSRPIVIACDARSPANREVVRVAREIARYGNSQAVKPQIVTIIAVESPPEDVREHEVIISLSAFDLVEVLGIVEGTLGTVERDTGALGRLRNLTGGIPGPTAAVVLELVSRGTLRRMRGTWRFRETEPIDTMQLVSLGKPLAYAWAALGKEQVQPLVALAILRAGADEDLLQVTFGDRVSYILRQLGQRGLLRREHDRWMVASELVRLEVLTASTDDDKAEVGRILAANAHASLDVEGLADVLLSFDSPSESISVALEAARVAATHGHHDVASGRLDRALSLARDSMPLRTLRELSLRLGEELNIQGKHVEARGVLLDEAIWNATQEPGLLGVSRSHLLGQLSRTLGDSLEAQLHFQSCAEQAKLIGDLPMWLRATADMAQIGWERGTSVQRAAAIERIRNVLGEIEGVQDVEDERASLHYGLGAALIYAGERTQAREILVKASDARCSDYWRMRIAVALGSVSSYLGRYGESLEWLDQAWAIAERTRADSYKARILGNRGATLHAIGRFRESAEQDLLSLEWASRTGNTYEYDAGLAGAAVNNLLLTQYEMAIEQARECRRLAAVSGDEMNAGKAAELEAMSWFYVGELIMASRIIDEGLQAVGAHGSIEVRTRLEWLRAKVLIEMGKPDEASQLLIGVERELRRLGEREDLLGVQVDLSLLASSGGDWRSALQELQDVVSNADREGVLLPRLSGAAAIGEIVSKYDSKDIRFVELLRSALSQADNSGVLEISWQLDRHLGLIASATGDARMAHTHLTRAIRTVRGISDRLSSSRRMAYLQSRRVRKYLDSIGDAV